jgi:type IV pilus assembly protein PilC
MEKMISLRRKIKGAMIYPATIISVAIIVTMILLIFVIPVFAELFSSFNQALPLPTQIVIGVSNWTIAYLHFLIGGAISAAIAIRQTYQTERGRMAIDRLMLKMPILGELLRKASIARFSRTLGTLVSSGVPILDSMTITARTSGNKVVERAGFQVRESISQGKTMHEPLTQSGVFPPMVCQMIAAGEMTGAIDQMLQKIADFYEEEVDNAVANLTALMEPLVIVVLGTIIGGLVIAMYLPIFRLGSLLSS